MLTGLVLKDSAHTGFFVGSFPSQSVASKVECIVRSGSTITVVYFEDRSRVEIPDSAVGYWIYDAE